MRTKYDGPGSPVLHTKVHGNWSIGSKEEDFKGFYHLWAWKPSGYVTNSILIYFHVLVLKSLLTNLVKKFVVSEKNEF